MAEQLILPIKLRDDATFANFLVQDNQQAQFAIQTALTERSQHHFIYLWGGLGCGRSHLLQASCHDAYQLNLSAFYLPLSDKQDFAPQILDSLESMDVVCIDDIQHITDDGGWQEALFHLYNRIQSQQGCLIIAGDQPPADLDFILKDLQSRLSAGLTFHLQSLEPEALVQALQLRSQHRGFPLSQEVAQFIVNFCQYLPDKVFALLEQLDKASLEQQRKITIPFVKQIGVPD